MRTARGELLHSWNHTIVDFSMAFYRLDSKEKFICVKKISFVLKCVFFDYKVKKKSKINKVSL